MNTKVTEAIANVLFVDLAEAKLLLHPKRFYAGGVIGHFMARLDRIAKV